MRTLSPVQEDVYEFFVEACEKHGNDEVCFAIMRHLAATAVSSHDEEWTARLGYAYFQKVREYKLIEPERVN